LKIVYENVQWLFKDNAIEFEDCLWICYIDFVKITQQSLKIVYENVTFIKDNATEFEDCLWKCYIDFSLKITQQSLKIVYENITLTFF
jgi:hypothetical protein